VRAGRSARAIGERALVRHSLPNALFPVTVLALDLLLFSGAVVTETVFAWPGMELSPSIPSTAGITRS
jgi:ABC-type dipeptide/oligopeptide/nickel transport system permease component